MVIPSEFHAVEAIDISELAGREQGDCVEKYQDKGPRYPAEHSEAVGQPQHARACVCVGGGGGARGIRATSGMRGASGGGKRGRCRCCPPQNTSLTDDGTEDVRHASEQRSYRGRVG